MPPGWRASTLRLSRTTWPSIAAGSMNTTGGWAVGARRLGRGPKARLRFSLDEVDALLTPCYRSRESTSEDSARSAGRPPRRRRRLGTTAPLLPVRGVIAAVHDRSRHASARDKNCRSSGGITANGFRPGRSRDPSGRRRRGGGGTARPCGGSGVAGEAARDRRSPGASERGGLPSSSRLRTTFGAYRGSLPTS